MVRVCLCAPEKRRGCFASEFLSCVKRIAFFGAEFNEMINDPQDSHSQQGEEKNERAEDSIGLLRLYVSCGPPLKMWIVFETWNPSFWLPRVGFPLMLLRQTETGLGFFFKLLSVRDETLVNGKYERLIRSGGSYACCRGAAVTVAGSENGLGCLSTVQSCRTICSDWFQLIVLTFPSPSLWTVKVRGASER